MAKNIPKRRVFRAERFAGKNTRRTWDGDHTILEQNLVRFALLSLISLPHQTPPSATFPCASHPAQDQLIIRSQHHHLNLGHA